ncbi:related to serine protease [Lecanosticta acicola]|uniref:Related to serine protease n=1 Tax=Lecanosticta acicola TaxID=111012 RepID=A0AAI9EDW6_9PEZI|nr:related to serine protease [Lecanosticta acicola]
MKLHVLHACACALTAISSAHAFHIRLGESRTIWQAKQEASAHSHSLIRPTHPNAPTDWLQLASKKPPQLTKRDTDPARLFSAHNLSVPIDHFHNESQYEPHSDGTFPLRYWFDASHYKPGGPVIILQSGETSGTDRLPFLQKGLLAQLARATNAIAVVLEHRYYGTSFPVPDLSTKNFRFLTTQQALADEAYFAQNIKFPGLDKYGDLTSKTTPYISYGGSYAGAFSAFLRLQYPDIFWGSISSSGVTKAIYNYPQYYEAIANSAPQDCVKAQQTLINVLDNIWMDKNDTALPAEIKATFGFANLTWDSDFAGLLVDGIGNWQSLNWDPAVSSPEVYNYCDNITSTEVLYPQTESKRANATDIVVGGGYENKTSLVNQMLNMIGYFNLTQASQCSATQDECFGTHNETYYGLTSIEEASYKSWPYQYCTEWGFIMTGDTPTGELPLVSRAYTNLEFGTVICRDAFGIYDPPDVNAVNKYGGYDISYERLAIVDGEWDPWRPATPHALEYGARDRQSTTDEPFILIPDAHTTPGNSSFATTVEAFSARSGWVLRSIRPLHFILAAVCCNSLQQGGSEGAGGLIGNIPVLNNVLSGSCALTVIGGSCRQGSIACCNTEEQNGVVNVGTICAPISA